MDRLEAMEIAVHGCVNLMGLFRPQPIGTKAWVQGVGSVFVSLYRVGVCNKDNNAKSNNTKNNWGRHVMSIATAAAVNSSNDINNTTANDSNNSNSKRGGSSGDMCIACALHVLCMCFACALHVLCMCFACALHVLCMCFACALHVLCMCFACALHVLCSRACASHVCSSFMFLSFGASWCQVALGGDPSQGLDEWGCLGMRGVDLGCPRFLRPIRSGGVRPKVSSGHESFRERTSFRTPNFVRWPESVAFARL